MGTFDHAPKDDKDLKMAVLDLAIKDLRKNFEQTGYLGSIEFLELDGGEWEIKLEEYGGGCTYNDRSLTNDEREALGLDRCHPECTDDCVGFKGGNDDTAE
jgi:hypothetical protein